MDRPKDGGRGDGRTGQGGEGEKDGERRRKGWMGKRVKHWLDGRREEGTDSQPATRNDA